MNSGLINGPVQAQKNGRWQRWEARTPGSLAWYTTPEEGQGFVAIVPIPPFVQTVRVTATAGSVNGTTSPGGAGGACKNVLFSMRGARKFLVGLGSMGDVYLGTLLMVSEDDISINTSTFEWGIRLAAGTPGSPRSGGLAEVYRRGTLVLSTAGLGDVVQALPFSSGVICHGFGGGSNQSNPLDSQMLYNASGATPSVLFYGPLAVSGSNTAAVLPGAGTYTESAAVSPAYVLVEWME